MVTVLVLVLYERPFTIQNRLVLNLCINNIIFCVYVLPVYIYDLYVNINSSWGWFCTFQGFAYVFLPCNIMLAYLHITLHRYFAIVFVSKINGPSYGSYKKTCMIIIASTLLVVAILFPGLLHKWGSFARSPVFGNCTVLPSTFNIFGQTLAVVLPLCTMIYCYSHILYIVRKQRTRVQAMLPVNSETKSQDVRLTVASVLIVLIFFISFMPTLLGDQIPFLRGLVPFQGLSGVLAFTHALTDPVIYVFFDKKLKDDLKKMFRKCRCN